ncbi:MULTISPECIES: hypothetical protein [Amycolatopsis]|uniref:hypothetical protein n=1 Tax=Amycolatopsis TaxID=1813 RepID=UPI000B8B8B8E|nr:MULTISPECIES: hypothetical protein [Amycolatopsis]OXM74933.1 hypothetical protein CF166_02815 [Amycolatopsis sp. KNN50.9b]
MAPPVVRPVFGALARWRRARVFHPRGILLRGTLETLAPDELPLPPGGPVVARLSKGAGLPGRMPDILGLALRIPTDDGPWDLTLASASARVLLRPARGWRRARFSSVVPYRVARGLRWILASVDGPDGASLDAVAAGPVTVTCCVAKLTGPATPVARIVLDSPLGDGERPSFDPMLHSPPGARLYPDWLSRLREPAYQGSRAGRR